MGELNVEKPQRIGSFDRGNQQRLIHPSAGNKEEPRLKGKVKQFRGEGADASRTELGNCDKKVNGEDQKFAHG